MQTQHTQGPWVALAPYSNRQATPIGYKCDETASYIIAESNGHNHEANARLIAAAPDLLAILREFCIQRDAGIVPHDDSLYSLSRAAIAKAKGIV